MRKEEGFRLGSIQLLRPLSQKSISIKSLWSEISSTLVHGRNHFLSPHLNALYVTIYYLRVISVTTKTCEKLEPRLFGILTLIYPWWPKRDLKILRIVGADNPALFLSLPSVSRYHFQIPQDRLHSIGTLYIVRQKQVHQALPIDEFCFCSVVRLTKAVL